MGFASDAALTALEVELADRWGAMRAQEGMAFAALSATLGQLALLGSARNSPYLSLIGSRRSPTPPWEWAAAYGAVVGFNAAIDPARPFQTLELPGVLPPGREIRFSRSERELLLRDGISTFVVDTAGKVVIDRAITTYQVNAFGIEDIAFLDVNTPLTLAYLRAAVRSRIALKFPRHKLASDGARYGAGQAIVTPKIIRAELIALFRELEEAGLVEDLDQFVGDLLVERDETAPDRVNALIPPNIVNQFRVFAGRVEFRL
jgi:phage tail sheath gpL-like